MNLNKAERLARQTEYAEYATHQDDNPINWGDAAAFYLEGYWYAVRDHDQQMQSAKDRVSELESQVEEYENAEAMSCPEDVGFVEYIKTLEAQVVDRDAMVKSLADRVPQCKACPVKKCYGNKIFDRGSYLCIQSRIKWATEKAKESAKCRQSTK